MGCIFYHFEESDHLYHTVYNILYIVHNRLLSAFSCLICLRLAEKTDQMPKLSLQIAPAALPVWTAQLVHMFAKRQQAALHGKSAHFALLLCPVWPGIRVVVLQSTSYSYLSTFVIQYMYFCSVTLGYTLLATFTNTFSYKYFLYSADSNCLIASDKIGDRCFGHWHTRCRMCPSLSFEESVTFRFYQGRCCVCFPQPKSEHQR